MQTLPSEYITILSSFARLFSKRIWPHAQLLLIGAILAPGQRTVAAVLRIIGLETNPHFQTYHRVLNRDRWSSLEVSDLLLAWLVKVFAPAGPIILGLDDTIERRRGAKIQAKGIYRDPVRSSQKSLCQSEWSEVVEPDAVDTDSMGQAGVGLALPDSPGTFGAVL